MGGDYPPTRMVETTGSNATFGNFQKRCNLSHGAKLNALSRKRPMGKSTGCSWVALNGGKGVTPVVMGDAPADCPRKILLEW